MAHKTLINGTAYEISGGRTLVNGTGYSIDKGKTLVGGTAYEVGFQSFVPVLDLGSMTFAYNQFIKLYSAEFSSTSSFGDLSAVNAVQIREEMIPLTNPQHTDANFVWTNYSHTALPTADGEYHVRASRTAQYGDYYINVYSFTDKGTCNVALGTV